MANVSLVDGHIDGMTTLEFILKCLTKAKINLEKQRARQSVSALEILNLEEKVRHYEEILRVWEEREVTDNDR